MVQNTTSKMLDEFVTKLLEKRGLLKLDLDQEIKDQLHKDLMKQVEDRINVSILSALPAERIDDLNAVLDTGTPEEIQTFLYDNISNYEAMLTAELAAFKLTYLNA